jgi:amino acid transporter
VPSVDHGIASVLGYIFGIEDQSALLKALVCGIIAVQACIHIFGVRLANRINSAAVFTEVIGMVGLVVVFGFLAFKHRVSLNILVDRGPVLSGQPYLPAFVMACLMGAYTLVGFESASNLSEETVNASSTVPKAVIWSVIVSGGIGTFFLILTALGIRDRDRILNSDYPLPTIIETNLGPTMAYVFFGLVVVSIFACGLVIMASGSRLIYAMARDNVFMANALFRRISPRTSVPVPALLLVLALGILAEIFSESLQQLLTAAAVLPALIYLLTVAAYAARRRKLPTRAGTFTLGRRGDVVAGLAITWLVVILAILTIPKEFRSATWVTVLLCVGGWILYWGWIRGKIARGEAGVRAIHDQMVESTSGGDR